MSTGNVLGESKSNHHIVHQIVDSLQSRPFICFRIVENVYPYILGKIHGGKLEISCAILMFICSQKLYNFKFSSPEINFLSSSYTEFLDNSLYCCRKLI